MRVKAADLIKAGWFRVGNYWRSPCIQMILDAGACYVGDCTFQEAAEIYKRSKTNDPK